jgi:GntR family histidine utilization transcriptional repressor
VSVLEIECRHLAGERPFCFEQRLINLEAVPEAAKETFAETSPGAWLLQRVPWTLAEHRIRATAADGRSAKLLGIDRGAAVLTIERTTRSAQSAAITFVRLIYPGDQHELVATFSPERGGRA